MSAPTKELSSLVNAKELVHNNNPIMRWMASNAAVYTDPNDNVRPVKNKSSEKIDGIVAAVMGIGLALVEPKPTACVWESRGMRAIG
jgi:phage terminase large subunit-like protein